MAEGLVPEFLADLVIDVTHVNGVFRLTLGQQEANNKVRPVARLLVPANQLGPIIQGVNKAAGDIATRIRAQAQERAKTAAPAAAPRAAADDTKKPKKN